MSTKSKPKERSSRQKSISVALSVANPSLAAAEPVENGKRSTMRDLIHHAFLKKQLQLTALDETEHRAAFKNVLPEAAQKRKSDCNMPQVEEDYMNS